jgi:AcrR family transcriptional regulator
VTEQIQQRRAGRPKKSVLDRDRIADAALAVVDATGDFTLPELARRLGVQTASLYHHVDGRAGVIELLRARMGELIDMSPLSRRPWDVALLGFLRSYRDVFAAHPRVIPLLTTSTVRSPEIIAAYEQMVVLLEEAGVRPAEVMTIVTALDNFVIGSALDLAAPEVMWEVTDTVDAPRLAAALAVPVSATSRADQAFDFGMETLMDRIRMRVECDVVQRHAGVSPAQRHTRRDGP